MRGPHQVRINGICQYLSFPFWRRTPGRCRTPTKYGSMVSASIALPMCPDPNMCAFGGMKASALSTMGPSRLGEDLCPVRRYQAALGAGAEETMIRLLISVAFAFVVATSAEAMSRAPLHESDARVTHIADGQPCDLKNQVRIWRCPRCGANRHLHVAHHSPGPPPRLPQVCGMERWYVR